MAQQSSIVFSPELDERQLDRETSKVNDELQQVGQDVPVNFDSEGLDGLGGGIGGDAGGGIGGAAMGRGAGAGAAAGLASKIPKPVAGVTAASAMPIALAGGVGLGMLNAMQGASARLQTSTTLLGQAWNNVWRPIGDKVDQLFVRDAVMDVVSATQSFEDAFRSGDVLGVADAIMRGIGNAMINLSVPGLSQLSDAAYDAGKGLRRGLLDTVDNFSWPSLPDFKWPSLPKFNWPSLPQFNWPSLPQFTWPNISTPQWPSPREILSRFPTISPGAIRNAIIGDTGGTGVSDDVIVGPGGQPFQNPDAERGGGGGGDGFLPVGPILPPGPLMQTGGRITGSGTATVHRGEIIADEQRLVSELADAIGGMGGGGGGGGMNTRNMERKLDQLNRNVKRLREALDVTLTVDGETLARAAQNGRQNRLSDRDPTI